MIDVPVWILFAGMFLLLLSLCLLIRKEIIVCRKSISFWSVKETIDNVPCGVCVSDPLGRIVLSNKKMRELGRKLTGEALQNYEDLKIVLGGRKNNFRDYEA